MKLKKGNVERPTGILVLYSNVVGLNPIEEGGKIIAANIMISWINHKVSLPAVTFPPVSFENEADLERSLSLLPYYDLIEMPVFELPTNAVEEKDYVNSRMKDVNKIVEKYVKLCADYIENIIFRLPLPPSKSSPVIDQLNYLEKSSIEVHKTILDKSDDIGEEELSSFWNTYNAFIEENPQFPLKSLVNLIKRPEQKVNKLLDLYFQQSRAILFENYEEAKTIQSYIVKLSKDIL